MTEIRKDDMPSPQEKGQSIPPTSPDTKPQSIWNTPMKRRAALAVGAGAVGLAAGLRPGRTASAQEGLVPSDTPPDLVPETPASIVFENGIEVLGVQAAGLQSAVAGAEFMDDKTFGDRLFRYQGGSTVLLSPDARAAVEFELAQSGEDPTAPGRVQEYAMGKWGNLLGQVDPSTNPTLVIDHANNRLLSFSPDGTQALQVTDAGSSSLQLDLRNPWYKPQVRWYEDPNGSGVVGTDSYRATHQQINGAWTELQDYVMLGNPDQIIRKRMLDLAPTLGIPDAEAKQFATTGQPTSGKSYEIVGGRIILVKGGPGGSPFGISPTNFDTFKKGLEVIAKAMPETFRKIVEQYGTDILAGDTPPPSFIDLNIRNTSTFDRELGITEINENNPLLKDPRLNGKVLLGWAIAIVMGEPRGRYNQIHLTQVQNGYEFNPSYPHFSNNELLDKAVVTKNELETKRNSLLSLIKESDYNDAVSLLQANIDLYSK